MSCGLRDTLREKTATTETNIGLRDGNQSILRRRIRKFAKTDGWITITVESREKSQRIDSKSGYLVD